MKKQIVLIAMLCLCSIMVFAQEQTAGETGYASTRLGIGVGMGQEIAFNTFASVHFRKGFYTGFHYLATSLKSRNVPDDYIAGTRFFSNSDRVPRDHFATHSLMIGQQFGKPSKRFAFLFETGLSWVIYSKALFSRKRQTPGFFGPIGDFDGYQTYNKTGWLLNGKVNYNCRGGINIELSTFANINSFRSVITENLSIVFNLLRRKSKNTTTIH